MSRIDALHSVKISNRPSSWHSIIVLLCTHVLLTTSISFCMYVYGFRVSNLIRCCAETSHTSPGSALDKPPSMDPISTAATCPTPKHNAEKLWLN